MRLPLRLAADPFAKQISDNCVSLGLQHATHHHGQNNNIELAMLVDDDGIHAFCSSHRMSRSELLSLIVIEEEETSHEQHDSISSWKKEDLLLLVRQEAAAGGRRTNNNNNAMEWYRYPAGQEEATLLSSIPKQHPINHDVFCAKLITTSISRYYAQQILEPSVRGFLSVLEKQFAHGLYLFELLQNAVDDGASMVKFAAESGALQVSHNGRRFSPLDVLGLSSVGLSTKSRQGKRTIGFMGVGFKAVYKRYARVHIQDGTYSFVYQEPSGHKGGYGWVMLPMWTQQHQHEDQKICHFSLERPRGGFENILRDLAVLPTTASPLLGRAALVRQSDDKDTGKWTLDWNGKIHVVQRTNIQTYDHHNSTEIVTVDITTRQGQEHSQKWLFVSHKYTPSRQAQETYHQHTKRTHGGLEEVCGFINLSSARQAPGRVHSVLPTKISLDIPMHVQGSWLLSVDRQQVQDLSDNAWNLDILQAIPSVVANFFRWAKSHKEDSIYSKIVLPLLPTPTSTDPQKTDLLGQSVSLQGLQRALFTEPILPVAIPAAKDHNDQEDGMDVDHPLRIATDHYEGERSIWVPPSFLQFLKPSFLRGWLGKRPLRADIFGSYVYHPIFASPKVIGQLDPLPNRNIQLSEELLGQRRPAVVTQDRIETTLSIMAAIGAAYDEHPDHSSQPQRQEDNSAKRNNSKSSNGNNDIREPAAKTACPGVPSLAKSWPVFLTQRVKLVTLDQIILPAEDFASVPTDLASLLRPYFVKDEEQKMPSRQNRRNNKKNGKDHRGSMAKSSTKLPLQRLHPLLEEAILRVDKSSGSTPNNIEAETITTVDWESLVGPASSFLKRARSEMPSNVMDVSSVVTNLFESYSKQRVLTKEHVSVVLQIAQFALETENSRLLSFVLVDDFPGGSSSIKLIPARESYTGKALDENGPGSDLESFAGNALPYVSVEYNTILKDSALYRRKLLKLFSLAGVQMGLSVSISVVVDIEKDRTTLQQRILPKLPEKKLPQLRKNATKNEILLPYGLEKVMNRKKYSLVDAQLSREWERLVNSMSPESAVGFISLLLAMPVEGILNASAKNVPAAAKCLSGQAETVSAGKESPPDGKSTENILTVRIANNIAVPLRSRLYFLPPGQPGAKALDISEARLVQQLKTLKWLPCATPSAQSDLTMPLTLLRPEEALLEPDMSRPEMPVVQLPDIVLKRLRSSPFAQALTWGTHAPPPPVTELVELAKKAKTLFSSSLVDNRSDEISFVATRMFSLWTAIGRAYLRDGLSASDLKTIRALGRNHSTCFIPVRRVLGSRGTDSWIVSTDRCVRMPDTINRTENSKEELKQLTLASFVASNFMCDFNHSLHNPFFPQPEISAAIIELAGIQTLSDFPASTLIRASGSFIRYCCEAEPAISSRFSPLRASFSYAMRWCIESTSELSKTEGGLKVWVRSGPGIGSRALRQRWVSPKNGPVHVVLNDNRVRSALLTPEMGIQLLGVLDHTEHERDCPNAITLSQIDKEVIKRCGIGRLSDGRFTVKTKARGTGVILEGAASKIQLVCALLKSMELDRILSNEDAAAEPTSDNKNGFLASSYDPPLLIRHDSLNREFQAPGMSSPSLVPMYAVFGRAPKLTKTKCILVCGEAADYSMELEELILDHVGALSGPSSQTKPYRAAVRLLSHLESNESFDKFLKRDFSDFEVTKAWLQLLERKRTIENLEEAEMAKDVKALRRLLVITEEMCENDPDGGDAVLQSARNLLPVLEAEAETRRVQERQNMMVKLKEAEKAGEVNVLRGLLIRAEELFEDDMSGGDAVLQSSREQLSLLEKEMESRSLSNAGDGAVDTTSCGRGRGVGRTLPAWMTSGEGLATAAVSSNNNGMPEDRTDTETTDSSKTPGNVTASGRGRGICNLPAWATSDSLGKASQDDGKIADAPCVSVNLVGPQVVGTGKGRGICNLPAWMTNDGSPQGQQTTSKNDSEESRSSKDDSKPTAAAEEKAKSILSTILYAEEPGDLPPVASNPQDRAWMTKNDDAVAEPISLSSEPAASASMGRGRGISNLPAWMTNSATGADTSLKRRHSDPSFEDAEEEQTTKKPRGDPAISEYILRLSINSALEPDFIDWLKIKIDQETNLRGGSATISPSLKRE